MSDLFAYQELLAVSPASLDTKTKLEAQKARAEDFLDLAKGAATPDLDTDADLQAALIEKHNALVGEDSSEFINFETEEDPLGTFQSVYEEEGLEDKLSEYIEKLDAALSALAKPSPRKVAVKPKGKGEKSDSGEDGKPSKKEAAKKTKAAPARKEGKETAPARRVANSGGLQTVTMDKKPTTQDEIFLATFWNMSPPGNVKKVELSKQAGLNKITKSKAVAEAKRKDLLEKYKPPKGKNYSDLFKKNREVITEINESLYKIAGCFGRYTNDATFKLVLGPDSEQSMRDKYEKNPEWFIVDIDRANRMKDLVSKRLKVYQYWAEAKGTRAAKPVVPLNFDSGYIRFALTPEATAWVNKEKFRAPEGISVQHNGKSYTDLKNYLADVLEKPFSETHLAQGLITKNTLNIILFKSLVKTAPTKEELEQKKASGDTTTAKYLWSPAMLETLGKMQATWDRKPEQVKTKTVYKRVPNKDKKETVISLLSKETKKKLEEQGKEGSPAWSDKNRIWHRNVSVLMQYLWDNSAATKAEHKEFFAPHTKANEAYLKSIVEEADAIKDFKDEVALAVSDSKDNKKNKSAF